MLFRVRPGSPVPLGDQIAACVRGALADGTLAPGERLPPAREVADSLGVNVHTVLRGYQRLRDEGLIELRRGRGAVVTATPAIADQARLTASLHDLVNQSRTLGLTDEDVLALVRDTLHRTAGTADAAVGGDRVRGVGETDEVREGREGKETWETWETREAREVREAGETAPPKPDRSPAEPEAPSRTGKPRASTR